MRSINGKGPVQLIATAVFLFYGLFAVYQGLRAESLLPVAYGVLALSATYTFLKGYKLSVFLASALFAALLFTWALYLYHLTIGSEISAPYPVAQVAISMAPITAMVAAFGFATYVKLRFFLDAPKSVS